MRNYYKAKELVLNQTKESDASYMINNHIIFTAYYALKHNISEENFESYLDSVVEKTHKKLFNCGCQYTLDLPLGERIHKFEGGGDMYDYAVMGFKVAVRRYYNELCIYNDMEEVNDGK